MNEPERCPTCCQVLPKRWTSADHAKLLREMAEGCPDASIRAAALERAAELEAIAPADQIGRTEEAFLDRAQEPRP